MKKIKLGKDYGGLIFNNYTPKSLVYKTYKEVLKPGHQGKKKTI